MERRKAPRRALRGPPVALPREQLPDQPQEVRVVRALGPHLERRLSLPQERRVITAPRERQPLRLLEPSRLGTPVERRRLQILRARALEIRPAPRAVRARGRHRDILPSRSVGPVLKAQVAAEIISVQKYQNPPFARYEALGKVSKS